MSAADGLSRVIKAAGSKSAIARGLGIKPQAVDQWDAVPLKRVVEVERLTGVPRHVQRPDFFSDPAPLPASASSC